jgi:hypothetical protein
MGQTRKMQHQKTIDNHSIIAVCPHHGETDRSKRCPSSRSWSAKNTKSVCARVCRRSKCCDWDIGRGSSIGSRNRNDPPARQNNSIISDLEFQLHCGCLTAISFLDVRRSPDHGTCFATKNLLLVFSTPDRRWSPETFLL